MLTDRPAAELAEIIEEMTERMRAAAADLQFEVAARLRDEVGELKKELRQMKEAGADRAPGAARVRRTGPSVARPTQSGRRTVLPRGATA